MNPPTCEMTEAQWVAFRVATVRAARTGIPIGLPGNTIDGVAGLRRSGFLETTTPSLDASRVRIMKAQMRLVSARKEAAS